MLTQRSNDNEERARTEQASGDERAPVTDASVADVVQPSRTTASLLAMQRAAGNHATAALLARQAAPKEAPRVRPDDQKLSQLRDIALLAINTYEDGAGDGILDARSTLASMSGWGPFATVLAGNLIWAAACFTTGGTAFVVSLAGIGLGSLPSVPKAGDDFVPWAKTNLIKPVVDHLGTQIDRVTRDVLASLPSDGWDDNRVREAILSRLFKPEYIKTVSGGIPMADRGAVAHRIHSELLIRANRQVTDPFPGQNPGYVHYEYTVTGHTAAGYEYGDPLEPVENWKFALTGGELTMEEGGAGAVAELKKDPKLAPAEMPLLKVVHLTSRENGFLVLTIDGKNAFFRKNANVVFQGADPQKVLQSLWRDSGGLPPAIETSKLK
jgi:hypothetical protein